MQVDDLNRIRALLERHLESPVGLRAEDERDGKQPVGPAVYQDADFDRMPELRDAFASEDVAQYLGCLLPTDEYSPALGADDCVAEGLRMFPLGRIVAESEDVRREDWEAPPAGIAGGAPEDAGPTFGRVLRRNGWLVVGELRGGIAFDFGPAATGKGQVVHFDPDVVRADVTAEEAEGPPGALRGKLASLATPLSDRIETFLKLLLAAGATGGEAEELRKKLRAIP